MDGHKYIDVMAIRDAITEGEMYECITLPVVFCESATET